MNCYRQNVGQYHENLYKVQVRDQLLNNMVCYKKLYSPTYVYNKFSKCLVIREWLIALFENSFLSNINNRNMLVKHKHCA